MQNIDIIPEWLVLTNDKKTITDKARRNSTGYGSTIISCKNNKNIYKWKFKINDKKVMIMIGIDDAKSK